MSLEIFRKVNDLIRSKERGVLGTIISSGIKDLSPGSKFLLDDQGTILVGEVPEDLIFLLQEQALEIQWTKKEKLVRVDAAGEDAFIEIFFAPIFPSQRLIVLGGGHIAIPLAQMGKLLNFEVTVIDDRPSFANPGRFPEADVVVCQDFKGALRELEIDNNTYVIIVTRGHRYDQTCLEELLNKPQAAYLGMIGSRRKVATIMSNLQEEGYRQDLLDRVYTPIGLDIGAQSPEEIAVSIMAEIIMVNRYGFSQGLKNQCAKKNKNNNDQTESAVRS